MVFFGSFEEQRRRIRATLGLKPHERAVKVTGGSASTAADLASLARDFEMARAFFDSYAAIPDGQKDPASANQAFWIAGIIMYGRAFGTGMRHSARASVNVYSDEQRVTHNFVMALRNKYVAHSVNGFEQASVFAILDGYAPDKLAISGVGTQHGSLASVRTEKARLMSSLCDVQLADIGARKGEVERAVMAELLAMGAERVLSLPELGMPAIDESAVSRGRSKSWE
ncbi:hypothetical protein [Agromyces sp. Marseille-Q5079]|uniref:hypothetical protein n=1 Tax=Agromyces sp. Marseille-Q5079 TaxID=3439059 RepID=UPI003D9C82BF